MHFDITFHEENFHEQLDHWTYEAPKTFYKEIIHE